MNAIQRMSRFAFLLIAVLLVRPAAAGAAPEGVPTLDDMAGDWMPFSNVENPPAVHNLRDMLLVDRDLTSVFCFPNDWLWSAGNFKRGFPPVTLTLDGRAYPATECRWFAYRALRRNRDCGGLAVESDTRMVSERRAVLVRVRVSNPGPAVREVTLVLASPGTLHTDGVSAVNATQRKGITTVTRPVQKPAGVVTDAGNVRWEWRTRLAPGDEQVLEWVASDDGWNGEFAAGFDGFKNAWERRWADAFTPGNRHFSGHLPVLLTEDRELSRNYYMGALTILSLERTQYPVSPRSFITSGERAPGTQYYWDASMQATAWALLEPAGMKATLRRWLAQNVRSGSTIDIRQTQGFDARAHNRITGYAFNACTIFQTAFDYLRVTGDFAFLDERLANGQTVLQRLDAMATDWKTLVPPGSALATYGENHNLLECAPAYIHRVPSLNAQNVLLMRQAAALHASKGNATRAKELRDEADKLVPAVLALYKPGEGVWYGLHNDGQRVELRHCVDFIYVGAALAGDLTPTMRQEMSEFAKRELLMRDWMRAMSLKDVAAARSDRPDHGPMGAFDGWIPLTVDALWRLGFPQDAFDFYRRTAVVTKEGPFAQAREFYGPNRTDYDAPVRVAHRQGCFKECISGGAFADVVIKTFFGLRPEIDGQAILADADTPRPFTGELRQVRHRGGLVTIKADSSGLQIGPDASAAAPVPDSLRLVLGSYAGARADLADARKAVECIVAEPDWYVWGGSVVEDGGKYHMFAERWPRKYGFDCWLTHAEIAHYVADRPEGPFRFVKTVLTGRGKGHWDQIAAYNPYLCKFNGKFYLYYVSTTHPTLDEAGLIETAKAGGRSPNWLPVRNAQRIGLAVAESLDGPWRRMDEPLVEPHGAIRRVTVNPAVCQGPDGRFYMVLKGDKPDSKGWTVIQAAAVAERPEGPWIIQADPVFAEYNTEDACLWFDATLRRFYAVVHVHGQPFMAMLTSPDGLQWEKAAQFKLMPKRVKCGDGSDFQPIRMERPFMLTDEQGNPRWLYLAILNGKQAYNLALGCVKP